jgi:hypothetical protein
MKNVKHQILVAHTPPINTKLDALWTHVGSSGVRKAIEDFKIEVIVFDSLKRFIAFEENNADEVNKFYVNIIKPIMAKYNVTIILLHHAKKDVQGANDLDMIRGSSDFVNLCDCILFNKRMPGKTWFELRQVKNRAKLESERKKILITDCDDAFTFTEVSLGEHKDGEFELNDCSQDIIKYIKNNQKEVYKAAEFISASGGYSSPKVYESINDMVINNMLIKVMQGSYKVNKEHEVWQ